MAQYRDHRVKKWHTDHDCSVAEFIQGAVNAAMAVMGCSSTKTG